MTSTQAPSEAAAPNKIAVLFVHGVGDQRSTRSRHRDTQMTVKETPISCWCLRPRPTTERLIE